jgi:hypothetical protein
MAHALQTPNFERPEFALPAFELMEWRVLLT